MSDPTAGVYLRTVSVCLIEGGRHGHVSADRVRYYLDRDPARWPRLSLVRRGRGYMVADGAHRVTAARLRGLARVRASVVSAATWADWCAQRRRLSWRRWD